MRLIRLSHLVVLILLFSIGWAEEEKIQYWVTHSLEKVRPQDPPRSSQSVELFAARNEFESFQIVLRVESGEAKDLDVSVSDLVGPGGRRIESKNITPYFQHYLDLPKASSVEGEAGEWPDPLIPKVDRYYEERRGAFPFDLRRGRNQPLWIEVYVPRDTFRGIYSGEVLLLSRKEEFASVPVKLTVWPFTLPSTSSLKSAFGLSGLTALKRHRGRYTSDEELVDFTILYAKAALLHRLSITSGAMRPPNFTMSGEEMDLDWSLFEREVGPFMDGTILGEDDPLPGARFTSIDVRMHGGANTPEKKRQYAREWVRYFRKKGWLDRLYNYLWDEPHGPSGDYSKVVEKGRVFRQASSQIRNLVTEQFVPELSEVIDIWTPLVNCFELKPGSDSFCEETLSREIYEKEIKKGKELWWYQSCGSHGCQIEGGAYFTGWPSYAIDVSSSVAHRIMEWLSWKYRIAGELYFNMNEVFAHAEMDPWKTVYLFGGNGDGTLLYPGLPERIGGRTHIPIESIRLKNIRDGFEDYEYLVLLSQRGTSEQADSFVNRIVEKTYLWERNPEVFLRTRLAMGRMLAQMFRADSQRTSGANSDAR